MTFQQKKIQEVGDNINELDSEEILLNLKIIAQIKEFEKLNILNSEISIDQSWIKFLSRSYYGNSRGSTINILETIVNNTLKITDTTLNNSKNIIDNNVLIEEPSHLLQRFILQMSNAINGLDNLKVTYKNDIQIISKLDLLIEKLKMRIEKINKVLTINIE